MNLKILALACVFGLSAAPLIAAPSVDQIVAQLTAQGYDDIDVERTWLGRIRIEAESKTREREIIINPRTGEILRDFSYANDDDDHDDELLDHD